MKIEIKSQEIKLVPLKDIKLNPKNRNKHPKEQIDEIAKIIQYQGFRRPGTISNRSGFLSCGEGRYLAAKRLKMTHMPVMFQDYEDEIQEYADGIADNALDKWAILDFQKINTDIGELGPFDISLLGIKDFEIDVADKFEDKDADEVPEEVEPIAKLGQIYQLGNHRLMCGDSTDEATVAMLMNGEKADMVFTDPPYGISYQSNWSKKFEEIKNDSEFLDFKPIIELFVEKNSPQYIWTSHQVFHIWRELFIDNYKSTIIWYKNFGGMGDLKAEYGHNYEMCLYLCNGRAEFVGDRPKAVWQIGGDNPSSYTHPTQKPVALAEYAISHHKKDRVLDLFGGSGSTLIACEKTNRKCFMAELDPHYIDVIIQRWMKFTGKTAYLIEDQSGKLSEPVPYVTQSSSQEKNTKTEFKNTVQKSAGQFAEHTDPSNVSTAQGKSQ